jgi:hypothetical protein
VDTLCRATLDALEGLAHATNEEEEEERNDSPRAPPKVTLYVDARALSRVPPPLLAHIRTFFDSEAASSFMIRVDRVILQVSNFEVASAFARLHDACREDDVASSPSDHEGGHFR